MDKNGILGKIRLDKTKLEQIITNFMFGQLFM